MSSESSSAISSSSSSSSSAQTYQASAKTIFRTTREKEMYAELNKTIEKLYLAVHNDTYMEECKAIHRELIAKLISNPLETYTNLLKQTKTMRHLESVVLMLLKKIFEINDEEKKKFDARIREKEASANVKRDEILKKDINQYDAMFQQIIIKVSQIFFKHRYYLTYRPTIETIVDMLTFIDVMNRSNSCKGTENPYFHSRRYLYYLTYMLDQYDKGHIVIPTYLGIGASDFIKIRCVPVYLIGANSDTEFADEYYNTPIEFFSHDVQHARRQLYYTEQKLYERYNKSERFNKHEISRSPFNIRNEIVLDDLEHKMMSYLNEMSSFTKEHLVPLLLIIPKNTHKTPLDTVVTVYNDSLEKGLRSMRKMILFEVLHEAALVPLPEVVVNSILMDVHKTPIERISNRNRYMNVDNVIYQDPTTLSNVLYKIKGTFFDTLENRLEFIVPVQYRTPVIVCLAALQILTALAPLIKPGTVNPEYTAVDKPNIMFNKLMYLVLNNKNRLQSTTGVEIEGLKEMGRVFTIEEFLDNKGNLLPGRFDMVQTTRMAIYKDPALLASSPVFYGPELGDQTGKVGMFGGTFDPPHNCHKHRIQTLYNATSLDKLVIPIVANSPLKLHALPQELRYKWTVMMIDALLVENGDPNLASFRANPNKNDSKIEVVNGHPSVGDNPGVGDTILSIRDTHKGYDVICIYGSDYKLKPGNKTPIDHWFPPINWDSSKSNFYQNVPQIQLERSEKNCDTSSTKIREGVLNLISSKPDVVSYITTNGVIASTETAMIAATGAATELETKGTVGKSEFASIIQALAKELDVSSSILVSYINYIVTRSASEGKNVSKESTSSSSSAGRSRIAPFRTRRITRSRHSHKKTRTRHR